MVSKMKNGPSGKYEVWMDEYQHPETNVSIDAQFLGEYEAFSFLEAVNKACDKYGFYKEKIIIFDNGSIFMPLMGMFYESEEAAKKARD